MKCNLKMPELGIDAIREVSNLLIQDRWPVGLEVFSHHVHQVTSAKKAPLNYLSR